MKLTTFKQILSLLFISLLAFDSIYCLERKFSANSHRRSHYKSHSLAKRQFSDLRDLIKGENKVVEKQLTLNVNNGFLRFFIGIIEAMGNNNTDWIKCLPEEWQKEEPNLKKAGLIQRQFAKMGKVVQAFILIIKHGFKIACNPMQYLKAAILDLLTTLFESIKDIKEHLAKNKEKKTDTYDGKKGGVTAKIKEKYRAIKQVIKEKAKEIWKKLDEPVRELFEDIGATLVEFVNDIMDFFKSEEFAQIIKFFMCMKGAGMFAYEIVRVFYGFYDKIQQIVAAAGSSYGAAVAPLMAKFAWGLICKFEEFGLAFNFAAEAITTEKIGDKAFYWGKFIGQIIHAVGTSRRKMRRKLFRKIR